MACKTQFIIFYTWGDGVHEWVAARGLGAVDSSGSLWFPIFEELNMAVANIIKCQRLYGSVSGIFVALRKTTCSWETCESLSHSPLFCDRWVQSPDHGRAFRALRNCSLRRKTQSPKRWKKQCEKRWQQRQHQLQLPGIPFGFKAAWVEVLNLVRWLWNIGGGTQS